MKKLCLLIIFFIILITFFLVFKNKERDYEIKYDYKKYKVIEKYDKKVSSYLFNITYNDNNYEFLLDHEYSSRRNVIEDIKIVDKENNCLKVEAFKQESATICYDKEFYILKEKEKTKDAVKKYENVSIFKKGKYLIWNNFGVTSLDREQKFKVLNDEVYNNKLFYVTNDYLIFADYDQKRSFNKFYVYDSNKDKINEFKIDYDISFDSYFMGEVDGYVYLYDIKNSTQYKINIDKRKIYIVSDKNGGQYYNKKWEDVSFNKLKYNELKFIYNNKYNYFIKDNKLYMTYYNSKNDILISDKNVVDIINTTNDKVYYLVDSSVYSYEYNKGEVKLMENFEWNFSYQGKIFIFG